MSCAFRPRSWHNFKLSAYGHRVGWLLNMLCAGENSVSCAHSSLNLMRSQNVCVVIRLTPHHELLSVIYLLRKKTMLVTRRPVNLLVSKILSHFHDLVDDVLREIVMDDDILGTFLDSQLVEFPFQRAIGKQVRKVVKLSA